jgi:hypothetical protein
VKYTQCVKIWLFDVLVLFLMCVQFLKPCVQFLMDTILNLIIVQFLVKKKGDMLLLHVSHISGKGRHTICGRISILLSCIKKDCQQKILHGKLLAPHTRACLDTCSVWRRRGHVEHKLFLIFKAF